MSRKKLKTEQETKENEIVELKDEDLKNVSAGYNDIEIEIKKSVFKGNTACVMYIKGCP
ncbi:MAG: hypothetical protein MJ247_06165 [Alphaproteobacteria bacterium]|nr:hypothetical protein [Alphaproteobacteria bacterium]